MLVQNLSLLPVIDPPSPVGHQRSEGEAEIAFELREGRSVLTHLYQRAPCRILFPATAIDDIPEAVLVTTSGGIAGGDRLRIDVSVEAGAAALLTSQAAEKIYRSLGPEAHCAVSLQIGDGAWLEWLPQETIVFQAARFSRSIEAKLSATGRLLASEMVVFGRLARGERFSSGRLQDRWRLHRCGRLIWTDTVCLEDRPGDYPPGKGAPALDEPLAFGGARAMATVVYAGPDAAQHLALARTLTGEARCRAGTTLVNGTLLARFLAEDPGRLRADLADYVAALRHAAAGLPARPPRLWQF
jgi:urease accessory protein